MKMRSVQIGLTVVFSMLVGTDSTSAADHPFDQYTVPIYQGPEAFPRFDSKMSGYRAQLLKASDQPINFAGHYVFAPLFVSNGCKTGGYIDVITGDVNLLPEVVCKGTGGKATLDFRPDSRLLVLSGKLKRDGIEGIHLFEFSGRRFVAVKRKENLIAMLFGSGTESDMPIPTPKPSVTGNQVMASIEPASGIADDRALISQVASDPRTGPLWKCFMDGLKFSVAEVAKSSRDQKEYFLNLVSLGGFSQIGDRVRNQCDTLFVGDLQGKPMTQADLVTNDLFVTLLLSQDKELFEQCDNHTDPSWQGVQAVCKAEKQKFDIRFGTI